MKTRIILTILALLIAGGTTLKSQDYPKEYLGLPGDNLNLYAVMKLFQESKTLEAFEKELNDPENRINNLDLNGDNLVDYIMVYDNVDGNVHYIVLRVAINRNENQDVAVFTVERYSNGNVFIQLTGDEALYGKNYIIEPIFDDNNPGQTPNPGYTGDYVDYYGNRIIIESTTPWIISTWPIVSYIYRPYYTGWRSSWYWGYYPSYWSPWSPSYWHYYYGYHYNWYNTYYCHYRRWHEHRFPHFNDYYYVGHRVYSPVVTVNINRGHYRTTYSHPEQRAQGEEVYRRNNPDQGRRTTYSTNSGTGNSAGRQSGSTSTVNRRTNELGAVSTGREQRPSTSSANEVRTIGSSAREQRPVQSSVREERSVQSSVREERTVQTQSRDQRPVSSSASEVRNIGSSDRGQRPVQSAVREERPVQSVTREERPAQTAVREERPVQSAVRAERPVQSAVREERPVQPAAREQRPVQAVQREERPQQAAVREQRPVQNSTVSAPQRNSEPVRAGSSEGNQKKTEASGSARRK